jgi:hypothetical protein
MEFVDGALGRVVATGLALLENESLILDLLDLNGGFIAVIVVVTWYMGSGRALSFAIVGPLATSFLGRLTLVFLLALGVRVALASLLALVFLFLLMLLSLAGPFELASLLAGLDAVPFSLELLK